jgi:CRISPR/Cas system-associated protein Cas10 (large subunit of type III CRISPR-Cas system)
MMIMETRRRRKVLGPGQRPCDVCGSEDVSLTESRRVRQGLHRLNPAFRAAPRRYDLCAGCGAKRELG